MIKVTRISGGTFVVNSDLIEFIEEKPETIICLTTGKKIMVRESVDEVIDKIVSFKGNSRRIEVRTEKAELTSQTMGNPEADG